MPRFLSPEWVAAFDDALAGVTLPPLGDDAGLVASEGRFSVAQLVQGGPEGDVAVLLTADQGSLHLALVAGGLQALDGGSPSPAGEGSGSEGAPGTTPSVPDVTVVLSYDDAVALASGALSPAQAITEGRIRVRGDLAVLSAGQAMLAAAQPHVAELQATTTY